MPIALGNVTTAAANVYVSTATSAVTFMSITNYSGSNVTANVFAVPNGSAAGPETVILAELELASQDSYQLYAAGEKLVLAPGDAIQVNASGNNAITTVTSYIEL